MAAVAKLTGQEEDGAGSLWMLHESSTYVTFYALNLTICFFVCDSFEQLNTFRLLALFNLDKQRVQYYISNSLSQRFPDITASDWLLKRVILFSKREVVYNLHNIETNGVNKTTAHTSTYFGIRVSEIFSARFVSYEMSKMWQLHMKVCLRLCSESLHIMTQGKPSDFFMLFSSLC